MRIILFSLLFILILNSIGFIFHSFIFISTAKQFRFAFELVYRFRLWRNKTFILFNWTSLLLAWKSVSVESGCFLSSPISFLFPLLFQSLVCVLFFFFPTHFVGCRQFVFNVIFFAPSHRSRDCGYFRFTFETRFCWCRCYVENILGDVVAPNRHTYANY